MKLNKRSLWSVLVFAFALLLAVPGDAFAQKRGGSRSRSRPSARRTAPKAKAKSKPKANTKRGGKSGQASNKGSFGSSKKKAGKTKKATKADKEAYEKAKANGTTFKNRKSAAADYKKKNAAKYTSTYASQPATRPGHIPQTTMVGGTQTTIIYNQGHGGYGYMGVGGSWIGYNAMGDVAMAGYYNRQMSSAGYYYGAPPIMRPRWIGPSFFTVCTGVIVVVVIGGVVLTRRKSV